MPALSDSIEIFIKELLKRNESIALQRNELAQHFSCSPSQINYVLSTRFTLEQGYVVFSRRGGGGYIRITRVDIDQNALLYEAATELVGEEITLRAALNLITRLQEASLVSIREAAMLQGAASGCALPTAELGDIVRARMLKSAITALLSMECEV